MTHLVTGARARTRLVPVALLGAVVLSFGAGASASGLRGTVQDSGPRFSSGTVQLEGTTAGSVHCFSTGSGAGGSVTAANAQTCGSGSPLPGGELSSSATATATTSLSSVGTVSATSATIASGSCGVAQLADAVSATDWGGTGPNTALAFGGLTYQAAGPLSTQAITTDGSTAWAETATEYTDPATFTVLVWLKTSASGGILGFSSAQDPSSVPAEHDRLLWVDPTGKLVWGIYGSTTDEITSPLAVNTGSWVFAAASVGPAGTALYVNGAVVASNATFTTPSNYMGWWTIAWASLTGWPDL